MVCLMTVLSAFTSRGIRRRCRKYFMGPGGGARWCARAARRYGCFPAAGFWGGFPPACAANKPPIPPRHAAGEKPLYLHVAGKPFYFRAAPRRADKPPYTRAAGKPPYLRSNSIVGVESAY